MGFRETTNYFGGSECSPNMTGLVDKSIGTAFPLVKHVAERMDFVEYVARNMATIEYVKNNMQAIVTLANRVIVLEDLVAALSSAVFPITPTVPTGAVFFWQLKFILGSDFHTVDAAVPADRTNKINMLWNAGGAVLTRQNDLISNFVKATLGKTDQQMSTLYDLARTMSMQTP